MEGGTVICMYICRWLSAHLLGEGNNNKWPATVSFCMPEKYYAVQTTAETNL